MIQLIYTSLATIDFTPEALQALLEKARCRNDKLEVTGMLIYHNNSFLQVLEGPELFVYGLYERIQADKRHSNCKLIAKNTISEKELENWSMGFVDLDDIAKNTQGFVQYDYLKFFLMDEGKAKNVLRGFQEGRWRQNAA